MKKVWKLNFCRSKIKLTLTIQFWDRKMNNVETDSKKFNFLSLHYQNTFISLHYIIPSFSDIWTDFLTRKLKCPMHIIWETTFLPNQENSVMCPGKGWLSCLLLYSTLALTNRVVYDSARSIRKWPGFNIQQVKGKGFVLISPCLFFIPCYVRKMNNAHQSILSSMSWSLAKLIREK